MALRVTQRNPTRPGERRGVIDALYRKYSEALQKFLMGQRVSREDAADIVQETYIRVQQSEQVGELKNPRAFLFRVAKNVRLNTARHRAIAREEVGRDLEALEIEGTEPGPYRAFQSAQELAIVRRALEELPARCREAFLMNRFEDMTFPQIAKELGVSVSMIEKHVSHAITHMRGRLEDARSNAGREALKVSK
ncbi:RNA polymerase sigma factor [Steroidobacter sp.]|uniref:RNA polymerase sigma factor n=1 Tax=Steroidobacter sp. TaxID=1978227 RepID=UPI001A3A9BE6|nr:sigma-70 family RNA polymerase sigma factor [Steroidobacter sp.]MBL8271576.1 sigma-70 family RNA polymerase sigma factor [Steroidobacter sp.]